MDLISTIRRPFRRHKKAWVKAAKGFAWYLLAGSVASLVLLADGFRDFYLHGSPVDWVGVFDPFYVTVTGSLINGIKELLKSREALSKK